MAILMTGSLIMLLVVPALFLLFAAAFGYVAWVERTAIAARWCTGAFLIAGVGMTIDSLELILPPLFGVISFLCHWVALLFFMQGFLARHRDNVPWKTSGAIMFAGLLALVHFTIGTTNSALACAIILNLVAVLLLGSVIFKSARYRASQLDRVIVGLNVGVTVAYLARLAFVLLAPREIGAELNSHESIYEVIFYLLNCLTAVSAALILMVAVGSDIITRHTQESQIDTLTGIGNRRALAAAIEADNGEHLFGAALMIDIDHFKPVNDDYGHNIGDKALADVAALLARKVDGFGQVLRVGGEEFAVLIYAAQAGAAITLAQAIRTAIRDFTILPSQPSLQITVSVGLARRLADEPINALLIRADGALYRAKKEGRDRVVSARNQIEAPPSADSVDRLARLV